MELLSQMLRQLLVFRDTDALLDDFSSLEKSSSDILNNYTLQNYLEGQQVIDAAGTIDQNSISYHLFSNGQDSVSVFRHLLTFCDEKLTLVADEPLCRYRHLLKWHELTRYLGEDIFTTAYLAQEDLKSGNTRTHFQWPAYLKHDNESLNQLMRQDISELHAHLKGSTLNFELSWLSLMNDVCNRRDSFRKLNADKVNVKAFHQSNRHRDMYMLVTIAACIRLELYKMLKGLSVGQQSDDAFLLQLSKISSSDYAYTERRILQSSIEVIRHQYGRRYSNNFNEEVLDYAITTSPTSILTVLTGERWLMYSMFKRIYDKGGGHSYFSLLFYIYLHIKSLFRNELIQTNPQVGFHNFSIFERRKDLFIPDGSAYDRLSSFLAFGTFLNEQTSKRYMEGRITPKSDYIRTREGLKKIVSSIEHNYIGVDTNNWRYAFVYHFIKRKDQDIKADIPRHLSLRKDVEHQAKAITRLLRDGDPLSQKVVGVDAANSEIYTRPEVFAQAFRFLRRQSSLYHTRMPLGMTYHVGEDFYDIASGLRAVDEVQKFLGFRANDRLGHALVLGTDVRTYYDKRGYEVFGTQMELLDNAVWLYFQGLIFGGSEGICQYLYDYARRSYLAIYQSDDFDIYDYRDAWLLRGDTPEIYLVDYPPDIVALDPWHLYALNDGKDAREARKNHKAQSLYVRYHYDNDVRKNGERSEHIKILRPYREGYIKLLEQIQQRMLTRLERLHIAVECNPSSNYKIGEMERYDEHPILKFYNFGIKTPYPTHEVSVSINTDDSGVFATSLDREYALMALALEKRQDEAFGNTPRAVVEWLNRVRKMSLEQRFVKDKYY